MKRSAHSCLRVSDVNHALADANVPSIHPSSATSYTHIPSHKIYTQSDTAVDLESVINSALTFNPPTPLSHESK